MRRFKYLNGLFAMCRSTETVILALVSLFFLQPSLQAQVVRTGYTAIVAVNSAKCLDFAGESSTPGTGAIQLACNWSAYQQWTVQNFNGSFRLIQEQTGNCLVSTTTSGAQFIEQPCSGVSGELWSLTASNGNFQILSKLSGLCASVSGASVTDSAPIVQQPCSTASNFLWTFSSGLITTSSLNVLQAAHSGQCLDVSGASKTVGAAIDQNACATSTSQQWSLIPSGGNFEVVDQNSALCLSNAGTTTSGASIVQGTCSAQSSSGDLWTLTPQGGSYQLVSANSGLCLTVPGATLTVGASLVQSACATALNGLWSISAAVLPSSWTGVTPLAVDPVAVGNLPNGTLVMWSANDQYGFEGDIGYGTGQTYTAVFDPSSMASTAILVTNTGYDMFCPGTANLFDGRILVNGGDNSPYTATYDPSTGLWTSDADMSIPRGYEGDTVLTTGSVLTLGGSWSGGLGGKSAEVWTQGGGWTILPDVPEDPIVGPDPAGILRGDNHLWLFTAPNGQVFHAGPSAQMHWIDTTGAGSIVSAGNRGDDPYSINGNAVMYDVGKILKTGGAPAYENANAEANTYLIDINNGVNGVSVTKLAPMAYPRGFSNGTILPNGQVVIVGGETYPVTFTDSTAVLIPEIWDPQTRIFRQLNPMQTPRVYHSTGILLSDGRVYAGGGGQCSAGCPANHFDTEILTPPYLLNPDGSPAARPTITSASSTVTLGGTISANTNTPVASFVLMRLSSVTHTVNNDQRRIPLQTQFANGTTYVLSVPSNPGIVLPGNYWLFALNAQGVPSLAANVLVSAPAVPGFTLSSSQSYLFTSQGSSTAVTITDVPQGGFSGQVTLSAAGLPAGVTASFGTNPARGTSQLTFTASSTAAAGTYSITVNGVSGSLTASTLISLVVAASCTAAPITPYLQVNAGAWQQTAIITVAPGSIVTFGPQPFGTWFWNGAGGFKSIQREVYGVPLSNGPNSFTGTYIDSNSCTSTQNFVITVASGPSFTLKSSAATLPITQGSTATDTITVAGSGGFSGSVTLSASGLPTGVTASFDTNPTAGTSVLVLTASSTAAAGTYNISVNGVSNSMTGSTTISLLVSSASCTPTPITPYLQVNGGAWQAASTATVAVGSSVNLGPQPLSGKWTWTGPAGFTSNQRELDGIPLNSGSNTFVATYVNPNFCSSNQTFVITAGSASGFSLTSSASTVPITQGSTATDTITVTGSGGFNSSVTLSSAGLPAGVTASFGTNPATSASVLTFTASTTAAAGTYNITVNGVSGSLTASTTISLVVRSGSCTPTPITPYLQVNGGAWQAAASATVAAGSGVNLGPQPQNGTWSWTGPGGFSSNQREVDGVPLNNGSNTFVATYVDPNSCTSVQTFVITVGSGFSLTPSASSLPITQGSTATDTITVTGSGGFNGSVTLSATGLPAGVTASFGTNPTTSTSVVTFTASSTTAVGTYNISVNGVSGSLTATTSIFLAVSVGNCTPTPITPYLQVNGGTWQGATTATVAAGSTVNFGPQPLGGTWSWTGPGGFTSNQREIDGIPLSAGSNTFVSTYINPSFCSSTQNFVITVGSGPGFTLTPSASSLPITQGSTASDTITVTGSGGFNSSVTLSATGLPAGVTASFGTNPATSNSVITFTASTTAAAGTYNITVNGVSGSLTASTSILLAVSGANCTPTPITPYLQVNGGAWQGAASATVAAGSSVNLGPQPQNGTWSWTGPGGFSSNQREIDGIPLNSGSNTFVATYVATNFCSSTQTFVITVGSGFSLTPSAPSLPITQASTATDTITVTPAGGFKGSVTLSAAGLPAGVTASFGTNPATSTSVVTFTASSTVAAGTYNIGVNGVSGSLTATTSILLAVSSGSCTPTPITPYLQVNGGAWQGAATTTVTAGSSVNLGPQPLGGTWSWTGPAGFTSNQREIDGIPLSTGSNTFISTYINPSFCSSTQSFVITSQ
jgi:galactose oxidase